MDCGLGQDVVALPNGNGFPLALRAAEVHIFQTVAGDEGPRGDGGHGGGDLQGGNAPAVVEGVVGDGGDAGLQDDAEQLLAVAEYALAQLHAAGDGQLGDGGAEEGGVPDGHVAPRQAQVGEIAAPGKGALADGGQTVGQGDGEQAVAPLKGGTADGADALGYRQAGDVPVAQEGVVGNGCDAVRNHHRAAGTVVGDDAQSVGRIAEAFGGGHIVLGVPGGDLVVQGEDLRCDVKVEKAVGCLGGIDPVLVFVVGVPGGVHDDPPPVHIGLRMGMALAAGGGQGVGAAVDGVVEAVNGGDPLGQNQIPQQLGISLADAAPVLQYAGGIGDPLRQTVQRVVIVVDVFCHPLVEQKHLGIVVSLVSHDLLGLGGYGIGDLDAEGILGVQVAGGKGQVALQHPGLQKRISAGALLDVDAAPGQTGKAGAGGFGVDPHRRRAAVGHGQLRGKQLAVCGIHGPGDTAHLDLNLLETVHQEPAAHRQSAAGDAQVKIVAVVVGGAQMGSAVCRGRHRGHGRRSRGQSSQQAQA